MRQLLGVILFVAIACGININGGNLRQSAAASIEAAVDSIETEDLYYDYEEEDSAFESLNDIRFADFEDNDWLDNSYIWAVRQYLDDFNSGKIEDESLEPYRAVTRGKFVIASTEPALLGGMFIMFTFIDLPGDIFSTWVYSDVDVDTRQVTNYTVKGILHEDFKSGMTKEEILKIVEEHPELKLF
ncbi:MAG: hypothetical protein IKW85_13800 [Muribaculaceae bacterium]|nr:hypothetical protein [Muribaculaceae bacterium]